MIRGAAGSLKSGGLPSAKISIPSSRCKHACQRYRGCTVRQKISDRSPNGAEDSLASISQLEHTIRCILERAILAHEQQRPLRTRIRNLLGGIDELSCVSTCVGDKWRNFFLEEEELGPCCLVTRCFLNGAFGRKISFFSRT